jgi:O-antigen/teichoic acid export membrane protein
LDQKKQHTSIVSSSIRIFIIRFFSTLASLITLIFFSHQLEPRYYGAYQNFWVHITVASSLGCMGLGLLIFNFPADTLRHLIKRLHPAWHFGYFALLILIGIAFTFLPESDAPRSWQHNLLSFTFYLLYTICILQEAFLIILKKFNLLTVSSLIYALAFVGSAIYTYYNGFRLETFIACLLPFLLLRSVMLFLPFYSFMKEKPEGRIMKPGLRNVQSLWMHLAFYDIITMLIIWFDKLIISFVATEETAAVYFNGSFNIPFLPIVLSAVSSATLIQLTHSSAPIEKARLMRQAGKVLSCAAYPLFFLLLIFRKEFVLTVFSEQYEASIPIFLCSIMILPVRAYSNTIVLQNLQKGRIMNVGVIIDFVVAVALIFPLFKWIGLGGVALSFVISTYVQSLFYLYHSARLLQVPMLSLVPLKNWGVKAAFFAILSVVLHLLLQHMPALTSLAIAAVVCGIASAIILKLEMNRANTTNT